MKKLNIWMSVIAMLICFNSFAATEYHGRALYGLVGNVKSVKWKTKAKRLYPESNPSFFENGLLCNSTLFYDSDGYPIGSSMVANNKFSITVDVKYGEDHRVGQITETGQSYGSNFTTTDDFEYSPDGMLVKETVTETDVKSGKAKKVEMRYSDYQFDSTGNWISRSVTSITTKENGSTKTSEFVETRTITYY